jgi:hypothetical protein
MVVITFPDDENRIRGRGFLITHFPTRFLRSGEHIVPEAALKALEHEGIRFKVEGPATYEHFVAPFRAAASTPTE